MQVSLTLTLTVSLSLSLSRHRSNCSVVWAAPSPGLRATCFFTVPLVFTHSFSACALPISLSITLFLLCPTLSLKACTGDQVSSHSGPHHPKTHTKTHTLLYSVEKLTITPHTHTIYPYLCISMIRQNTLYMLHIQILTIHSTTKGASKATACTEIIGYKNYNRFRHTSSATLICEPPHHYINAHWVSTCIPRGSNKNLQNCVQSIALRSTIYFADVNRF